MKKTLIAEQKVRHRKLFDATNMNTANKFFHMEDAVKRTTVSLLEKEKLDPEEVFLILERLVKIEPFFHTAMIAWPKNRIAPRDVNDFDIYCLWWDGLQYIRMINPIEWRDRSRLPWIKNCMKTKKENWCAFYADPLFQCDYSTYAAPCKDFGGNIRGIVGIGFSLQNIGFDLKETTLNQFSNSFIYFKTGRLLFRSSNGSWYDPLHSATNYFKADLLKMIDCIQQEMKKNSKDQKLTVSSYSIKNIMGARRVYILQCLSDKLGGVAGEFILEQRIQETSAKANNLIFLYFSIAFVLTVFLSWFFARYFTRPITALKDSIYRIAVGDFDAPLPQKIIPQELNDLRNSFEIMQTGIKNQISQLAKTTALQEMTSAQFDIIKVLQQKSFAIDFEKLREKNIDFYTKIHVTEDRLSRCFYDFDLIDGELLAFCIGRFACSNVSYLLFTAQIAAFLWGSMTEQKDPALALWLINQELNALNKPEMLFSVLCGIYNPKNCEITFAASEGFEIAVIDPSGNVMPISYMPGPRILEKTAGEFFNESIDLNPETVFFCCLENEESVASNDVPVASEEKQNRSMDPEKATSSFPTSKSENKDPSDDNFAIKTVSSIKAQKDSPPLDHNDKKNYESISPDKQQNNDAKVFRTEVTPEQRKLAENDNFSKNTKKVKYKEKLGQSENRFLIPNFSENLTEARKSLEEINNFCMQDLIDSFMEKCFQPSGKDFDDIPMVALRAKAPLEPGEPDSSKSDSSKSDPSKSDSSKSDSSKSDSSKSDPSKSDPSKSDPSKSDPSKSDSSKSDSSKSDPSKSDSSKSDSSKSDSSKSDPSKSDPSKSDPSKSDPSKSDSSKSDSSKPDSSKSDSSKLDSSKSDSSKSDSSKPDPLARSASEKTSCSAKTTLAESIVSEDTVPDSAAENAGLVKMAKKNLRHDEQKNTKKGEKHE